MIPRVLPKKFRQTEIRTSRHVTGFAAGVRASARFTARTANSTRTLKRRERRAPIPTGLCPPARGCEERATLGHRPASITNRNAVAAIPFSAAARGICHNPVGVGGDLIPLTQGSSCVATPGWRTQSRWDCSNALLLGFPPSLRYAATGRPQSHSVFVNKFHRLT